MILLVVFVPILCFKKISPYPISFIHKLSKEALNAIVEHIGEKKKGKESIERKLSDIDLNQEKNDKFKIVFSQTATL